jgi:hypothetical protein
VAVPCAKRGVYHARCYPRHLRKPRLMSCPGRTPKGGRRTPLNSNECYMAAGIRGAIHLGRPEAEVGEALFDDRGLVVNESDRGRHEGWLSKSWLRP